MIYNRTTKYIVSGGHLHFFYWISFLNSTSQSHAEKMNCVINIVSFFQALEYNWELQASDNEWIRVLKRFLLL